jgi:hypothetical protein
MTLGLSEEGEVKRTGKGNCFSNFLCDQHPLPVIVVHYNDKSLKSRHLDGVGVKDKMVCGAARDVERVRRRWQQGHALHPPISERK